VKGFLSDENVSLRVPRLGTPSLAEVAGHHTLAPKFGVSNLATREAPAMPRHNAKAILFAIRLHLHVICINLSTHAPCESSRTVIRLVNGLITLPG
jgi:hypothetical protein